jgi:predicted chitinase
MINLSLDQLQRVYKEAPVSRLELFYPYLIRAMEEGEINTPQRIRMFLAQIGHESGQLRYVEEIASGEAYEGRRGLGNTQPGDGKIYNGRGLIQLTGRRNYALCSLALDLPLLDKPELLLLPEYACRSAVWYWQNNNLNALADAGFFKELTRRINGGTNGYADRYKLYQRAFDVVK